MKRDADTRDARAAYLAAASAAPWAYDLFAFLRRLEALHPDLPRFGRALRPSAEAIRIGEEPSAIFAPSTIASLAAAEPGGRGGVPKARIYSFGLFGPNGPLPFALTEYVIERIANHRDRTLAEFADIFHQRLAMLFYRAWAEAQSTASLDRPGDDVFSRYLASILHFGLPSLRGRTRFPDAARLGSAGHLVRQTRNAEGLAQVLARFFRVRVQVEEFRLSWLPIPAEALIGLGSRPAPVLGGDAILGSVVLDRQHRFRLRLGPLSLQAYEAFLPGADWQVQLLDWVRVYVGIEYEWDACLVLAREEVPAARLSGSTRLGWTTWLGGAGGRDREDLVVCPERDAGARAAHYVPTRRPHGGPAAAARSASAPAEAVA